MFCAMPLRDKLFLVRGLCFARGGFTLHDTVVVGVALAALWSPSKGVAWFRPATRGDALTVVEGDRVSMRVLQCSSSSPPSSSSLEDSSSTVWDSFFTSSISLRAQSRSPSRSNRCEKVEDGSGGWLFGPFSTDVVTSCGWGAGYSRGALGNRTIAINQTLSCERREGAYHRIGFQKHEQHRPHWPGRR